MGTALCAQSYKSRGSPTEFLWRFKSFRQTLPFTWVTLTAQLTNLCLMGLNFVHMTETINIKAQAQVTAAHLLLVCARPGLPRSTSLFPLSGRVLNSDGVVQGLSALGYNLVTFPKSLLHCNFFGIKRKKKGRKKGEEAKQTYKKLLIRNGLANLIWFQSLSWKRILQKGKNTHVKYPNFSYFLFKFYFCLRFF